jgi:threonine/homoserine/homoserine lactone efflux protein
MDAAAATLTGVTCGLAIAVQVGPVSLLLVETAVAGGRRTGFAAGLGVATADFAFAAVAAASGGAAGAALAGHAGAIHLVAAAILGAIAVTGLGAALRAPRDEGAAYRGAGAPARGQYLRFLGITIVNPLTIASFAAVAAALSLDGALAATGFIAGVGLASASWHAMLGTAAGHAGRWMTPAVRRGLAVGGRVVVLALAIHLALAA